MPALFQLNAVFRPCIDLHEGKVKQIVGGTLKDGGDGLRTNFVSEKSAAWFAELYRKDGLTGGHVILLGPGNEAAAREALAAYPGGLHLGGGVVKRYVSAVLSKLNVADQTQAALTAVRHGLVDSP